MKKLSQEFSKTEIRILGALSQLDEFLQNPPARAHSWPVPETSRFLSRENQKTNEDSSQDDPHLEVGVSLSQSTQDLSPEETSYSYTTVYSIPWIRSKNLQSYLKNKLNDMTLNLIDRSLELQVFP